MLYSLLSFDYKNLFNLSNNMGRTKYKCKGASCDKNWERIKANAIHNEGGELPVLFDTFLLVFLENSSSYLKYSANI